MGRPLITDDTTLAVYCNTSSDYALTERQRARLARGIAEAESAIVRVPSISTEFPRVISAHVTIDPTALERADEIVTALCVIRAPRYAVRNREAPKRSTLLRRLWSALR